MFDLGAMHLAMLGPCAKLDCRVSDKWRQGRSLAGMLTWKLRFGRITGCSLSSGMLFCTFVRVSLCLAHFGYVVCVDVRVLRGRLQPSNTTFMFCRCGGWNQSGVAGLVLEGALSWAASPKTDGVLRFPKVF